jgi:hypothetical protein
MRHCLEAVIGRLNYFSHCLKVLKKLNRNLKIAFDPQQIFNPYRMQKDW